MATIEVTKDTIYGWVDRSIPEIRAYRSKRIEDRINALMSAERKTFFGSKLPSYTTREEAIEALKAPSDNMFISSEWLNLKAYGKDQVQMLTNLRNLASEAEGLVTITLDEHLALTRWIHRGYNELQAE